MANSQKLYQPGSQNAPFGLRNTNPEGSNYQGDSIGGNAVESNLIEKAIKDAIFDSAPKQFDALKLAFSKAPIEKGSDEFEYLETGFGRNALTVLVGAALVAASAGAQVTQTVTLDAASLEYASIDLLVTYPDGTEGVIQDITGAVATIGSRTNVGLSAIGVADTFSVRSTIEGDGMDTFSVYQRTETITRYNYVQFFMRAKRWAKVELQKYINQGTTNYIDVDKKQKMKQLRIDLFASYFNGHRGEYQIANGIIAKSMGGIFPSMQAAGSLSANPTLAGLQSAFEKLAFATNFKAEGGTRFIYGSDEMLYEFSKIYKQPGLRYEPNNETANLKLKRIEIGTQNWVLVPCELFRENSVFPDSWKNKLLFLDVESIRSVKMKGLPTYEMGATLDRRNNGTRENYQDWYCGAQFSLEFNNPLGCFSIDVQ
jgi:hypothetical protein